MIATPEQVAPSLTRWGPVGGARLHRGLLRLALGRAGRPASRGRRHRRRDRTSDPQAGRGERPARLRRAEDCSWPPHGRRAHLRDPHALAARRALQRARRRRARVPCSRRRSAAEEQLPPARVASGDDQGRRPRAAVPRPAPHGRDAGCRERHEPQGADGSDRPLLGGRRSPLSARHRRPGRGDRSVPGALRSGSLSSRWRP
jgi:hypothetical protein